MTSNVVVIGPPDDDQVVALVAALKARGETVHVHHMGVTDVGAWSWSPDGIVTPDGLCLTDARSVFVRSIPIQPPVFDDEWIRPADEAGWLRGAAGFQRVHGFLKSVHLALTERGIPVVNPLEGFAFHRSKPATDLTLAEAGIPVPRGVATSDPALVRDLMDEVGPVVYKPVAGGGHCRELDPARLDVESAALAMAPCYFQELVPGENLRIYILGGRLLAAFIIDSEEIDFRDREGDIRVVSPPSEVVADVVTAAQALGLVFTGADVKLPPDGGHVVLDVNPSPMFARLDELVDGAITSGLAEHLIEADR